MNIRDLRRVFPAIRLQAYPRGFVLSRTSQSRRPFFVASSLVFTSPLAVITVEGLLDAYHGYHP